MSDDEQERSPKQKPSYKMFFTTESMIELIREYPCIWNRSMPQYRDKVCRQQAWEEIYRQLEPSYDDMKPNMRATIGQQISKKWFNVRDAYLKSRKDRSRKPYMYTKLLSYLDPFLLTDKIDKNNDDSLYLEDQLLEEETDNLLSEPTFVYVDESERPKKKPRLNFSVKSEPDISEDSGALMSEFSKIVQREDDAEKSFFLSIVPVVKDLSAEAKLEFQIEVLKLLKAIKRKDESGETFE